MSNKYKILFATILKAGLDVDLLTQEISEKNNVKVGDLESYENIIKVLLGEPIWVIENSFNDNIDSICTFYNKIYRLSMKVDLGLNKEDMSHILLWQIMNEEEEESYKFVEKYGIESFDKDLILTWKFTGKQIDFLNTLLQYGLEGEHP